MNGGLYISPTASDQLPPPPSPIKPSPTSHHHTIHHSHHSAAAAAAAAAAASGVHHPAVTLEVIPDHPLNPYGSSGAAHHPLHIPAKRPTSLQHANS